MSKGNARGGEQEFGETLAEKLMEWKDENPPPPRSPRKDVKSKSKTEKARKDVKSESKTEKARKGRNPMPQAGPRGDANRLGVPSGMKSESKAELAIQNFYEEAREAGLPAEFGIRPIEWDSSRREILGEVLNRTRDDMKKSGKPYRYNWYASTEYTRVPCEEPVAGGDLCGKLLLTDLATRAEKPVLRCDSCWEAVTAVVSARESAEATRVLLLRKKAEAEAALTNKAREEKARAFHEARDTWLRDTDEMLTRIRSSAESHVPEEWTPEMQRNLTEVEQLQAQLDDPLTMFENFLSPQGEREEPSVADSVALLESAVMESETEEVLAEVVASDVGIMVFEDALAASD